MNLALRDHLAFCIGEERAVFLDTEKWRYFALSEKLDEIFRQWATGAVEALSISETDLLVRAGVMVQLDSGCHQPERLHGTVSSVLYPQEDFQQDSHRSASKIAVVRVAIQQAWCWWLVRRHKISNFHLAQRSNHECRTDLLSDRNAEILSDLVLAFDRTDSLFGNHDRCLVRSMAFTALCRQRGIEVMLILGVRDLPFAAHAWVQHRRLVVNDTLERVRLFTPILVM
ncbi:lasso peptide biosynthesis B2 protein [Sphingobium cupriresistens]|uniref:Lasso peptide biosynthesis B2 protein n=1 Tax=Sphingobium cupriresistens TaxID=1132417 RepID=A0A8G2DVW7_9SPHN|nr:lasso peptide biosynthesis B2 protein [Sphingobium cupriresistens]RYM09255.1 lasso peptide biosynthesis B2 protein [Sphingobium cupriresistens]